MPQCACLSCIFAAGCRIPSWYVIDSFQSVELIVSYFIQHSMLIGRRLILKCLIDIRRLFIETGDMRYIFNDLYIEDYCTWIQHVR